MPIPPEPGRQNIDRRRDAAGLIVQDRAHNDLYAGRGVSVRELRLEIGAAECLLFVDRKWAGVEHCVSHLHG